MYSPAGTLSVNAQLCSSCSFRTALRNCRFYRRSRRLLNAVLRTADDEKPHQNEVGKFLGAEKVGRNPWSTSFNIQRLGWVGSGLLTVMTGPSAVDRKHCCLVGPWLGMQPDLSRLPFVQSEQVLRIVPGNKAQLGQQWVAVGKHAQPPQRSRE